MRCIFYFLTLAVCSAIESTSLFLCCGAYISMVITVRKRSLGQGNVFTAVCHSVYRWAGDLPNSDIPLDRDPLDRGTPRTETPWTENPLLDRDSPPGQRLLSLTETPLLDRDSPPGQRLSCTETLHPVNRMTHGCKTITLPQTSFAEGNKETD